MANICTQYRSIALYATLKTGDDVFVYEVRSSNFIGLRSAVIGDIIRITKIEKCNNPVNGCVCKPSNGNYPCPQRNTMIYGENRRTGYAVAICNYYYGLARRGSEHS